MFIAVKVGVFSAAGFYCPYPAKTDSCVLFFLGKFRVCWKSRTVLELHKMAACNKV
jgi:hypothetical protein